MEHILIGGKNCYMEEQGKEGPLFLWGMFPWNDEELTHTFGCIREAAAGKPYALAAFSVEDWNREFSPWPAPQAFGTEPFAGEGRKTLDWMMEQYIPELFKRLGERPVYLIGYSLAGLFTLWAAYETEIFDGIACCSGSLWYPDWNQYMESHRMRKACRVYLSLGGKEEKTKNQMMARVGDRTRQQEKLLKADTLVKAVRLEWNGGGHFADSGQRLAKGVDWLLKDAG